MTSTESLSGVEIEVLQRLAQSRETLSSVKFAAEMYDRHDEGKVFNQDVTYEFVCMILARLNELGLITYRLSDTRFYDEEGRAAARGEGRPTIDSVPVHVRLTTDGYHVIGYDQASVEVRLRRSYRGEGALRVGDLTDFRSHAYEAVGYGEVERMSLHDHLECYPEHCDTPGGF